MIPTAYLFISGTCSSSGYFESESEANAAWESASLPYFQQCPNYQYSEQGWVSPSSPMCSGGPCGGGYPEFSVGCGGAPTKYPIFTNGAEVSNWVIKSVEYDTIFPSCATHHAQYFVGAVRRDRQLICPRGYVHSGGYCYLHSGWIDPAKNLGGQCPTCGNPISPGSGNKFQKENDFTGAGDFPLRFDRYYNSLMRVFNLDAGLYGESGWFPAFGNDSFPRLAVKNARAGLAMPLGSTERRDMLFWSNVGHDMIGANWRHTYQRAIRYVTNPTSNIYTAFAYRHDGRVLSFIQSAGVFHPQADVTDRLTALTAGGWELEIDATGEVETYNSDGQLQSIRNRAGLAHTLHYDLDGRLQSVSDAFGRSISIGYAVAAGASNAAQRIVSVTDPAGGLHQYGYGANGTLTTVTHPDATVRQYVYGSTSMPRALTSIVDESGSTYASFNYDSAGQATLSEHAGGAGLN